MHQSQAGSRPSRAAAAARRPGEAAEPDSPGEADESRLTALREMQLVEAHRQGDPEALGTLLRAYQKRIYAICYRMVRHPDDAIDLTQDTLMKVMEGLEGYDSRSAVSTWIIRIAMNTSLSHLRKQRLRRHASLEEDAAASGDPLKAVLAAEAELSGPHRVEQSEVHRGLGRALLAIDPAMRAVLVLRDLQDLEYQQISEVLDLPVGTVKSRLFRARAALREAAEQELGGDRSSGR